MHRCRTAPVWAEARISSVTNVEEFVCRYPAPPKANLTKSSIKLKYTCILLMSELK